ncbi:hypothetical protein AB6B38_00660 [Glycocaulis abyssi]|uniref:REase AHJR-like domain-containing protein n=1 Tax=Glycocaulis abyssi TaxID=1433403 RepID=A0ABV9NDA2_9PROT
MAVSDTSLGEHEAAVLERLRERYTSAGYTFATSIDEMQLPVEFGGYVPDAVASRGDQHVAIEVKIARRPSFQFMPLTRLREIVEQHPGWTFSVAYTNADDLEAGGVAPASSQSINKRLAEIEKLSKTGFLRAAFVMAWPLLEAIAHGPLDQSDIRPLKPGTVVQSLIMEGHLTASDGARLRDLIKLRNQIVHGNLDVEPSQEDVEFMLQTIRSIA